MFTASTDTEPEPGPWKHLLVYDDSHPPALHTPIHPEEFNIYSSGCICATTSLILWHIFKTTRKRDWHIDPNIQWRHHKMAWQTHARAAQVGMGLNDMAGMAYSWCSVMTAMMLARVRLAFLPPNKVSSRILRKLLTATTETVNDSWRAVHPVRQAESMSTQRTNIFILGLLCMWHLFAWPAFWGCIRVPCPLPS